MHAAKISLNIADRKPYEKATDLIDLPFLLLEISTLAQKAGNAKIEELVESALLVIVGDGQSLVRLREMREAGTWRLAEMEGEACELN